ncbi:hypothetical protein O7600_15220 [Micromonospora sp. WMMA1998]|uniref:hypothetical protein n=1 Tax=Micromonospora sp. WMMA1998 TaxID=3015167 RepID=UPI00248AF7D9|nr:hypothetical protein [Micromonospora sp. WMMA1998]WBC12539.1 hypothetical protein O7600_15220 [Micromonospora sp. WMMA1998]
MSDRDFTGFDVETVTAAVRQPPLDDLRATVHSRRRHRRNGIALAAAAVLAVAFGATALVRAPRDADPARPAATPSPTPSITTPAGTPEDWARIDAAVVAALLRQAPELSGPGSHDLLSNWNKQGGTEGETTLTGYWGQGTLSVGAGNAHLSVQIERDGGPARASMINTPCPTRTAGASCVQQGGPAGEKIKIRTSLREHRLPPQLGNQVVRYEGLSVDMLRPDGSTVSLNVSGRNASPPLTPDQAVGMVLDPQLVLGPLASAAPGVEATD